MTFSKEDIMRHIHYTLNDEDMLELRRFANNDDRWLNIVGYTALYSCLHERVLVENGDYEI